MMAGDQLGNVLGSLFGYLSEEGKQLLIEVFDESDDEEEEAHEL